jgi:hypothetical protein
MSEFSDRLHNGQLLTLFHGGGQNKTACQELWITKRQEGELFGKGR